MTIETIRKILPQSTYDSGNCLSKLSEKAPDEAKEINAEIFSDGPATAVDGTGK